MDFCAEYTKNVKQMFFDKNNYACFNKIQKMLSTFLQLIFTLNWTYALSYPHYPQFLCVNKRMHKFVKTK